MEFTLPTLRKDEIAALKLRALFETAGYKLFRMGSFEAYDLYMQNKSFLSSDDIITFTGADGRLMALKPDVTLSIVKNTRPNEARRVYYNESVFRRSRDTGEYREINQTGLECIGFEREDSEAEVLKLAAESLSLLGESSLDISHMGLIEAVLAGFSDAGLRADALAALRYKSEHDMFGIAKAAGLSDAAAKRMAELSGLSGPLSATLTLARRLTSDMPDAAGPLDELDSICRTLEGADLKTALNLDLSILNDVDYYNGVIFRGFLKGMARYALAGGRYDNLMARFDKSQGAIGFALYLDTLEQVTPDAGPNKDQTRDWLNIALPKGRMGDSVLECFEKAGYICGGAFADSRRLVYEDEAGRVRYYLVKPGDVDSYVEHGVADIGVVGKDLLLESSADVLELADLKLGVCRLVTAGKPDFVEDPALPLRVATKYPNIARRYFADKSRSVEIIKLGGSIELAPLTGLSDIIVDIVESGTTLRENNLVVLSEIAPSSARLIANRASWSFKNAQIRALLERISVERRQETASGTGQTK